MEVQNSLPWSTYFVIGLPPELALRDSCQICEIFKNNSFYWTSPVTVSDSCSAALLKKGFPQRCFSVKFAKLLRAFRWLLRKFICEFYIFQNISFIEHLREIAYFMYKLQNFNHHIQWKTISQVFFKHFIQEREVAIRRRSFT